VAHRKSRPEETQLERLLVELEAALRAAEKPDEYEAFYFPAHAYALGARTLIYTTGLAILAHADVRVHHHNAHKPANITHHIHRARRLKQTRICAHIRFMLPLGEAIDIFNTHLSLPTALSREFWTRPLRMGYGPNQLEEAKNLVRFVDAERASDRFLIICVFNALPGSPVYRYLVDHGFRDPFAQLHRMTEEELRSWPTAGFMRLRMHLDHIFSGAALTWMDFDGSRPFGDRAAEFHGLSDHMPIIGRCHVASTQKRESARPARASSGL
jgi:endonuclease/exonuclease/phosphatase family metal-dependent hydrolase